MATVQTTPPGQTPPPKQGGDSFDDVAKRLQWQRPVPGQGLLSDPENPLPFERPPEYTNFNKAKDYLFSTLMDMSENVAEVLSQGISIEELTNMTLRSGYQQGKWNVDLMMLLIEPTVYFLLFICEVGGIDYVLSNDEEDIGMDPEDKLQMSNHVESLIKSKAEAASKLSGEGLEAKASEVIPQSLLARVESEMGGTPEGGLNG